MVGMGFWFWLVWLFGDHSCVFLSSIIKNSKYSSGFLSSNSIKVASCVVLHASCVMVIIESDADVIIKAINSGGFSSSSFGHINSDIKLLSSAFHKVSYSHTRRQGNRVAHRLARMACNFSSFQV